MTEQREETCFVRSNCDSISGMKRFSHEAMATTFEVIVVHEDQLYAQQAAIAAFHEVDRLEGELSRFIGNSDISRLNNLPANQALTVGFNTFECLQLSVRMYEQTTGAFDITIGPLLSCWLNKDGTPRRPSAEELNLARQRTGTALLQLSEAEHTVQLLASPMQVDLGGIGKGYAVDRMAELLREWSINTALISGGYSTVLALEAPAGTKGWPVTLSNPADHKQIVAHPNLQHRALSGSGLQKGQHIIDPRTAKPVENKRAAWSFAADAATADALSTAFMITSTDEIEQYCQHNTNTLAVIMLQDKETQKDMILHYGSREVDDI